MIVKDVSSHMFYQPQTYDKPLTKEEEEYYRGLQEYYKNRPAGSSTDRGFFRPWMVPVLFS